MQLQYASLLLILRPTLASTWMCGIGPFSGAVAYLIALPTDTAGVNRCCIEHDALIENFQIAREEADRVFCQCLSKTNNWYTQYIVEPLFCITVKLYTKLFENNDNNGKQYNSTMSLDTQ